MSYSAREMGALRDSHAEAKRDDERPREGVGERESCVLLCILRVFFAWSHGACALPSRGATRCVGHEARVGDASEARGSASGSVGRCQASASGKLKDKPMMRQDGVADGPEMRQMGRGDLE